MAAPVLNVRLVDALELPDEEAQAVARAAAMGDKEAEDRIILAWMDADKRVFMESWAHVCRQAARAQGLGPSQST